jgi:hypothetical protein
MFGSELDQLDELNNLAGSDLGETFGFTGANGRAVLSQLKKDIIVPSPKAVQRQLAGRKVVLTGESSGSKR